MLAIPAIMLVLSGTVHLTWTRIPALALMGTEALSWLVVVCLACVVAALGLWRCAYWGYLTAVVVLILGLATHFFRALVNNDWRGIMIIAAIGVLILWYLRSRARLFVHRV